MPGHPLGDLLHQWLAESRRAIADGLTVVLERFERHGGAYPYIDMKLRARDGVELEALAGPETDFRSRSAVFGWIQGRGLEALAGHADHLAVVAPALAQRSDRMLAAVAERILDLGRRHGGRYHFLYDLDGRPFTIGGDGSRVHADPSARPPGFADLFVGKGLAAAGRRLARPELLEAGAQTLRRAAAAIADGSFRSDQVSFDPKNPMHDDPRIQRQGSRMIMLGAMALMLRLQPGEEEWRRIGAACLRHVLDVHVVSTAGGGLRELDFVEQCDPAGAPWRDAGRILQDPGHALEFTGLAARFLLALGDGRNLPADAAGLAARSREVLPRIFLAAFANGFQPGPGGICKSFDLVARQPINDDMPWWSLSESMRAAALLARLAPDHPERGRVLAAGADCAVALFGRYRSAIPGIFVQTRDASGEVVDVVPATPDADPGYHTGLCLIDVVEAGG
jgi:mannose/cellobiose epimerase-like protein (N-acyl-D-glucosamine 2-epimerase family)